MSPELFAAFQEVLENYSVSIEHCVKRGDGEWLSRVVWSTRKPGQHGEIHKESPWEGYENTTDAIKALVEAHKKPVKTQRAPKKSPLLHVFGPFMWKRSTEEWFIHSAYTPCTDETIKYIGHVSYALTNVVLSDVKEDFEVRVRNVRNKVGSVSYLEYYVEASDVWRIVASSKSIDKSFDIVGKHALVLTNCLMRLLAEKTNYFKQEK